MQFGDILVCIDESPSGRKRTEFTLALAARSHARVVGYYRMPAEHPANGPRAAAMDVAAAEFDRQLKSKSLDGLWVAGSESRTVEDIANYARCVDLVVAGLGFPGEPSLDPQGLDVERLVIECGRPVLGIPIANIPEEIGRSILVAWDGSRQSARALHDAIPFLQEAEAVKVVSIGGDPTSIVSPGNVVAHLKRRGISATVDAAFDLQLPIGEEILSRIEREGADLLVAGAFGHSRLREHIEGGVSITLLHQMMIPVLVSH
jgi:nucleotide-binding universal stress UspA family protein